jgi:hypothetical protein
MRSTRGFADSRQSDDGSDADCNGQQHHRTAHRIAAQRL